MNIAFLDFWEPFDKHNNFFYHALKEIRSDINIVGPEKSDLLIYSVFGENHQKFKNCKKLFFTGENIKPNFRNCNYSISFDFRDYRNKNFRLPLWYLYIDWFDKKTYSNPEYLIPKTFLYEENIFSKKEKKQFCSTVISKMDRKRNQIINLLSTYKKVNVYGKVKNGTFLPYGEENKLEAISNYKFSVCYENSIAPGYVTEKLLHAKVAGCIPIYFSHNTFEKDFNKNCCINTYQMRPKDILETIKEIDSSSSKYKSIREQPLFERKIDLENLYKFLNKVI